MFKRKTSREDFCRAIEKKTGADIRLVETALPDLEEAQRFERKVSRTARAAHTYYWASTALGLGMLFNMITMDVGFTERPVTREAAQAAVFTNGDTERQYFSNVPQKATYVALFLMGSLSTWSLFKDRRKNLEQQANDIRALALVNTAKTCPVPGKS